jgi:hypothetical protein
LYDRWRRSRTHRRRCLEALRHERLDDALAESWSAFRTQPGPTAARLLAVCHFLNGSFAAALAIQRWANAAGD